MAHTPLMQRIVQSVAVAAEATRRNQPVEAILETQAAHGWTRRSFLRSLGASVAGAAATAVSPAWVAQAATRPGRQINVAIVGAGLAGLTCAHRLRQAGIAATIFEANTRLGGRCWTRRGDFVEGQVAEHGGELIDQSHVATRQLVQELGLELNNLLRAEAQGTEPCYYFDGSEYSYAEATSDLKQIWRKLHRDLSEASYPTLYHTYTPRGFQLDQMSVLDWINESVPGGIQSRLGQLLDTAYNIEYGAETAEQSALNLLYLLGYAGPGQLRIFGASNEKYHVRGGNDQIVARLAAPLSAQIVTGAALVRLAETSRGACAVTLQKGNRAETLVFDKTVLALPVSILRSSVDLTAAGFSARKRTAIYEVGMGASTKLNVQFRSRPWRPLGCTGETYSDRGYQAAWEVTRGQAGESGILVNYTGGTIAAGFGAGAPAEYAARFLGQVEPVFPGLSAQWNGRATLDVWSKDPFTLGSYSFWKVGQYTRFGGVEGEPERNWHFAGEYTSVDAQGYLEGAVESGERVAREILAQV